MEFIHNSYNPGVTEMYVFVPMVFITAVVLYLIVRKART